MDLRRGHDDLKIPSSLQTGRTHHDHAPLSAEDDEISLDCSSEESQSSDVPMSDSDSDGEQNHLLISTGNEHSRPQSLLSTAPPAVISTATATQQGSAISRKRRSIEAVDTSSCAVISTKKVKLDRMGRDQPQSTATYPSDRSLLPAEIWHRIFSFIPPRTLGNLLCINKLFNAFLDPSSRYQCKTPSLHSHTSIPLLKPDTIWQISRRRYWPRMPAPLKERSELDMWRLACGRKCQYCDKAGFVLSNSPSSPSRNNSQPIWAFSLHSCGPCLVEKTIKEIDLLLSSSIPSLLMPALPFVLVSDEKDIISPDALQKGLTQPNLQVTKMYLPAHVERLKEEFASVKSMGGATAEEWLKGLEPRGKGLFTDLMRWEKWMSAGGVIQMQTQLTSDSIPNAAIENTKGPASAGISLSAPKPHSCSINAPRQCTPDSCYTTPIVTSSQPTFISLENSIQRNYAAWLETPAQHSSPAHAPRVRTREEALELKAVRRAEIERRAMDLDPPLPASMLARIPSFRAAIQIISPLDDNAWEMLKPRLLAQRADAEQLDRREEPTSRSDIVPERTEGRCQAEENSIAAKQLIDKKWDDTQTPLRARISAYADEMIHDGWDDGRKVDAENSPQFAAEVLLHVRRRFYTEIAKESAELLAAGKVPVEDPPEGPFTLKLTLENMKWLFDVKIKVHTESHRKDLFFCNGCDVNFKAFGFEGVIQHYAAKHSTSLSLGSVVVHWRAEWPETPPFRPDPRTVKAQQPSSKLSYGSLQPPNYADSHYNIANVHSNSTSFPPSPYFAAPPPGSGHLSYGSTSQQLTPYGQGNPYIPGKHEYSSSYPSPRSPYDPLGASYPSSDFPFSGTHSGPLACPPIDAYYNHNLNALQNTSQATLQATQSNSFPSKYHSQLGYLARSSRELWTSTAGLKELPGDIRVRVVIYHIVQRFRSRFFESPPLAMFIDGLSNNKEMRPVRNINSLMCKACCLGLDRGTPAGQGSRTFSLPQLVNHFQQTHVNQPRPPLSPSLDWTTNMVHTPDLSVLSKLRNLANMDSQKFLLISNAFPTSPGYEGYCQEATIGRLQSTRTDPIAQFNSQNPTYSTPDSEFLSDYGHPSSRVANGHDTVASRGQELARASMMGQKLVPDPIASSSSATLTTHQRLQQDDSGQESSEAWQGANGMRSWKQKGNHSKDYRNIPKRGLKNRKRGVAAGSITAKSPGPDEGDLVAEEDRRQEEEIRAMWAADRREAARLASQTQHSNKAKEADYSRAALGAEKSRSSHSQAAPTIRSTACSARSQGHFQPVVDEECKEDDLIAVLESQLDMQQVPSEYRPKPADSNSHERSSYGQYASFGHHEDSQRSPYKQNRPGSPVYVRHDMTCHGSRYRERNPGSYSDLSPQPVTIREDKSFDQSYCHGYDPSYASDAQMHRTILERAKAYELIRTRDSRGEYFVKRPVKLERNAIYPNEHSSYKNSTLQLRTCENDGYSGSWLAHEPMLRLETHLGHPPKIPVTLVGPGESSYETIPRDVLPGYEDYDPRYPNAPPGSSIEQHVRYR
ncbi:hypothetical protein F5B19DRAFT_414789 [Rostrohypoxylon terebratum]|nr:hypothetical protein F5B19DRAFT_414789 [Rostrohypoxylon terebratum]